MTDRRRASRYAEGGIITSPHPIPLDDRPPTFLVRVARDVAAEEAERLRAEWRRMAPRSPLVVLGPGAEVTPLRHACPNPIEVTRLDRAEPEHICGCGYRPPPTCACGDRGTHRPEPGIGCVRPGCLCLEPGEPSAQVRGVVVAPPNPGRVARR